MEIEKHPFAYDFYMKKQKKTENTTSQHNNSYYVFI